MNNGQANEEIRIEQCDKKNRTLLDNKFMGREGMSSNAYGEVMDEVYVNEVAVNLRSTTPATTLELLDNRCFQSK